MSYEDSFYIERNIIGYTGNIGSPKKVTVYFLEGKRFGRITQDHDFVDNIGRELVREYDDYEIANDRDTGNAYEIYGKEIQHESRNSFTKVTEFTRDVLAEAIIRHKKIKSRYLDTFNL